MNFSALYRTRPWSCSVSQVWREVEWCGGVVPEAGYGFLSSGSRNFWWVAPCWGEGGQEACLCACPAHGTGGEWGCPPSLGSSGNSALQRGNAAITVNRIPNFPPAQVDGLQVKKKYDLFSRLHCPRYNYVCISLKYIHPTLKTIWIFSDFFQIFQITANFPDYFKTVRIFREKQKRAF